MKDLGTKDLGTKYTCFKCQARFYDLKKPAPICPKCGADQREMPQQSRQERKKPVATRLEAVEDADEEVVKEDEDEETEEAEEEAEEP